MTAGESPLAMSERHVREGEQRVARQERLVAELDHEGHPEMALQAQKLLETLQDTLRLSREHLAIERGSQSNRDRG